MVSYEYIAGFFDGEGYIQLGIRSPGGHSRSPYYLTISMANTHRGVLDEIQKMTGGVVRFYPSKRLNVKSHYRLALYTRQALNFIKAVQPYLIVKKEEADLAIAFYEHIESTSYYFNHGCKKMTEKELKIRHEFWTKMRVLNGNQGKFHLHNLSLKSV